MQQVLFNFCDAWSFTSNELCNRNATGNEGMKEVRNKSQNTHKNGNFSPNLPFFFLFDFSTRMESIKSGTILHSRKSTAWTNTDFKSTDFRSERSGIRVEKYTCIWSLQCELGRPNYMGTRNGSMWRILSTQEASTVDRPFLKVSLTTSKLQLFLERGKQQRRSRVFSLATVSFQLNLAKCNWAKK